MSVDTSTASADGSKAADLLLERGIEAGRDIVDPLNGEFANALIERLASGMTGAGSGWVRDIIDGTSLLARNLNVESEHGLIEVIQNADDLGATRLRFALVPGTPNRLLVAHDGARVEAEHVLAMTLALVSTKRNDAMAIGKFGIGMKTLSRLAESLEVHSPPYHFRVADQRLESVAQERGHARIWDAQRPETLLVLNLREDYPREGLGTWFERFSSDDLIFLEHVRLLELCSPQGELLQRHELRVQHSRQVVLRLGDEDLPAREQVLVDADMDRRWVRLSLDCVPPAGLTRSDKATPERAPLAIAHCDDGVAGRLFAGLPLSIGGRLPFSFNAQFDTDAPRTGMVQESWNEWVLDQLAELGIAAALHRFAESPAAGWSAVPCVDEVSFVGDLWLRARLRDAVRGIQKGVAERAQLPGRSGLAPLARFVAEAPALDELVGDEDLALLVGGEREALLSSMRDPRGRWRKVSTELGLGGELSVEEALAMLHWPDSRLGERPPGFFIGLAHSAIAEQQKELLVDAPFVVLADGRRVSPKLVKADGLVLVTDAEGRSLGHRLGLACPIAPEFAAGDERAQAVREYLQSTAGLREQPADADALRALSELDLARPLELDDEGLRLLRDALAVPDLEGASGLAGKIGRRILVDGITYVGGERQELAVRPSQAYLPANLDPGLSWAAAAAQTPGLGWVHPRYAGRLMWSRSSVEGGSEGERGSQQSGGTSAFFRSLGAETAPRLSKRAHDMKLHGVTATRAHIPDLPAEQRRALADTPLSATGAKGGLVDDYDSPDLEAVCEDIVGTEVDAARPRAAALLAALGRSWGRLYEPHMDAQAVQAFYRIKAVAEVPATWRARAAQAPWMFSESGKRRAPRELAVRTRVFVAMIGEAPDLYALDLDAAKAGSAVVLGLAFESEPRASTLVKRLEELREADGRGEDRSRVIPGIYAALDALSPDPDGGNPPERIDDLTLADLRRRFGLGEDRHEGLVCVADGEWLAPSSLFLGRPIFGSYARFVSEDASRLWRALQIGMPDVLDCVKILHRVAESVSGRDELGLLSEIYRYLVAYLETVEDPPAELLEVELWTPRGWVAERPIYAVGDTELQQHLARHLRVWQPPIRLDGLKPLLGPLGVELLDEESFVVMGMNDEAFESGEALRLRLTSALAHLREWLALNDAELHDRLSASEWERLLAAPIALREDLQVDVPVSGRGTLQIPRRAHLQRRPDFVFAFADADAIADTEAMGPHLELLFGAEKRERIVLTLGWKEAIELADRGAALSGVRISERDVPQSVWAGELDSGGESDADDALVAAELAPVATSPQAGSGDGIPRPTGVAEDTARARPAGTWLWASERRRPVSRRLQRLPQISAQPQWAVADARLASESGAGAAREILLRSPDAHAAQADGGPRSSPTPLASWTRAEREALGLALVSRELAARDVMLTDLHDKRGFGADAVDQHEVYYELKVHEREIPDSVTLTAHEYSRARGERDKFVLVIVGGLEEGYTPMIRMIRDPLAVLRCSPSTDIELTGILSCS